jgi:hypothetical protein
MVYNFVTKTTEMIVIILEESISVRLPFISSAEGKSCGSQI